MNSDLSSTSSIANLLRELRDEATTLLRQQVTLAKVELKENVSRLGGHIGQIAIGGLVAFVGTVILLVGLGHLAGTLLENAGLQPDNARWLGFVLVGGLVVAIGAMLLAKAKKALADDPLTPRKTIESLRTDQQWAQEKLQHSHESTT